MSLLSVTVKKAHYVAPDAAQYNSYVTLKLQNVKSTTVTVKGASPCWEQDFLFETNDVNTGLLIEVWCKGMIWDRAMGYHWLPLQGIQFGTEECGSGQWLSLDAELVMRDGVVVGTKNSTGNALLVDCRFELPFDPENIGAADLQRKLEMLNNIMDQEARAEQARRQMQYFGHSGYSEDSDYTSDLNYPVGQHANSSASQFRSAAHQMHTPQRSLETSRENSYERDDQQQPHQQHYHHHQLPVPPVTQQHNRRLSPHRPGRHMQQQYSPNAVTEQQIGGFQEGGDSEPLFYNSRPNKPDFTSSQDWGSYEIYYSAQQSLDGVETDYIGGDAISRKSKASRRPSLERQTTLYDEYTDTYATKNQINELSSFANTFSSFNNQQDIYSSTLAYNFQEERYGQDQEDRQWNSGGPQPRKGKKLPTVPLKRRSSIDDASRLTPTHGRRKMPQIPTQRRSASRQSSINDYDYDDNYRATPTELQSTRGASLPPTPTKTPKIMTRLLMNQNKPFNSLPPTPGRQLPKPNVNSNRPRRGLPQTAFVRTSSEEYPVTNEYSNQDFGRVGAMSARDNYNDEYYNYAYQSTDNLISQSEDTTNYAAVDNKQQFDVLKNAAEEPISLQQHGFNADATYKENDYYTDEQNARNNQSDYFNNQHSVNNAVVTSSDNLITNSSTYYGGPDNVDGTFHKGPLVQQQTMDSIDELDMKDSFDTAVSSMDQSFHNSYPEYSTAPLDYPYSNPPLAVVDSNLNLDKTQLNGTIDVPSTSASMTAPLNQYQPKVNGFNRGYLKQQDTIDHTAWTLGELGEPNDTLYEVDEQFLEEEEEELQNEDEFINGRAINGRESPVSVIHVDDDQSLRRGSSQITVVDSTYNRDYMSRRASTQDADFARKPPQEFGTRRTSTQSPEITEQQTLGDQVLFNNQSAGDGGELLEPVAPVADVPEKKCVSFEDEEDHKPSQRPQVTAQQRWHWAYNKIIMQLNVSFPTLFHYRYVSLAADLSNDLW